MGVVLRGGWMMDNSPGRSCGTADMSTVGVSLLVVSILSSVHCAALSADGRALLAFLDTFRVPSGVLASSWRATDETPCGWMGVVCSVTTRRVVNLTLPAGTADSGGAQLVPELGWLTSLLWLALPSLNLKGTIPAELANCSALLHLDLSNNNLTGNIPPELGKLSSLHSLLLFDNRVSGLIPPDLGSLSSLEIFRAGGNPSLFGPIPIALANCSRLVQLGLAATAISGPLPAQLGNLVYLSVIMIFQANLSGPIPPGISNCSRLAFLHLYENHLSGPLPPQLGLLRSLISLNLWQNELSGPIPPELGSLSECLEVLELSENRLSGSIPPALGKLASVVKLYLSSNLLSGSIPGELGNCSSLIDLQLDRNYLHGTIPPELGKLSSLTQLFLWNNSLQGHIPARLGDCKKLEFLDFSCNQLTGPIPEEIFDLKSLHKLLLLSNQLSGTISPAIAGCTSLYRLRLDRNNFSGSIPPTIGALQNLTFIDISRNQFSGPIPATIGNCRALQLMDAHDNQLTGSLPREIGFLSNLQSMDVSNNRLIGHIPSEIGMLDQLMKLSLMRNYLIGSIPVELGGCRKLSMLDLSSNQLSGRIPSTLGRIKTLSEALNLSCNQLSGPIPQEFAELLSLGALDISHNRLSGSMDVLGAMGSLVTLNCSYNFLSGPLPCTYIFTSIPSSSYAGNPGISTPSCFDNNSAIERNKVLSRRKPIMEFLFGSVGLMLLVGSVLICLMIRSSGSPFHEQDNMQVWPWLMTPFQKVYFTVDDVLDRLVDSNIIGKGCSGMVYKAQMPQGEIIAIKKVVSSSMSSAGRDVFAAEVEALRSIRHVNIVRLLGYCTNHQDNLLLYDYMPNGSLGEMLHEKRRFLDWDTRYSIALGAAQALAYLHHDCVPPILHRDIKANNILLGARLEPYLADFGLAKVLQHSTQAQTQSMVAGSYGYIAPEYAYTLNISDKSDVYSYGVVLLEMLTGRRAVEEATGLHVAEWVGEVRHCHVDITDTLDSRLRGMPDAFVQEMVQVLGVAMDCVHTVPEERPSMRHVVSLLIGIRHEPEEYAKLDVLAGVGPPPCRSLDADCGHARMVALNISGTGRTGVPGSSYTNSSSLSSFRGHQNRSA